MLSTTTLLGYLETANLDHCTTHVSIQLYKCLRQALLKVNNRRICNRNSDEAMHRPETKIGTEVKMLCNRPTKIPQLFCVVDHCQNPLESNVYLSIHARINTDKFTGCIYSAL